MRAAAGRHPAGRGLDVDDDQRAGVASAAALRARRRGAGRRPRGALGDDPERHPEGVHRPRQLHLPGPAEHAPHRRHVPLLHRAAAALEHDLDLGLPHPRGRLDRRAGARVHASPTASPTCRRRSTPGSRSTAFARRLSFFFNAHNDFFTEVAKFRAARMLWAEIMRDRFGARDQRSQMLRFHAQTGGSTLTAQQAENNIVRVAVQALSAVCGGAQSLHTNGYDEALALPTERIGDDRASHPADPCDRGRRHGHDRPAGRELLHRGADRRAGRRGPRR